LRRKINSFISLPNKFFLNHKNDAMKKLQLEVKSFWQL